MSELDEAAKEDDRPPAAQRRRGFSAWIRWVREATEPAGDDFGTAPNAMAHSPQDIPEPTPPPEEGRGFLRTVRILLKIPFHPAARRSVFLMVLKFRAPAVGALLMSGFLAFPEQTREIYVKLAEDHILAASLSTEERISGQADLLAPIMEIYRNWGLYSNFAYVLFVCFGIWACARWIGFRTIRSYPDERFARSAQALTILWFPRLLGIVPLLGLAWGISATSRAYTGTTVSRELTAVAEASLFVISFYILFLFAWNLIVSRLRKKVSGGAALFELDGTNAGTIDFALIFIPPVGFAYLAYVFAAEDVEFAQSHGPIIILCAFAYEATLTLTALYLVSRHVRWPWTGTLVTLVLLQSCAGWTDNDQLSQSARLERVDFLRTPTQVYKSWRGRNPNAAPIVIAAQGGGLYAAYHAAMVLARLHDTDHKLGARVMAVSGVSGGAVGAAVFDVIHRSGVCRPTSDGNTKKNCYTDTVREVLRRDFLSPVLGSMLFPDLLTRVIPNVNGLTESLSRARRLEDAFDDALRDVLSRRHGLDDEAIAKLLDTPVLSSSVPDRPLLLMNATDVNTGERMVMAALRTFDNNGTARSSPQTFAEVTGCPLDAACKGPDVLAAGIVSARFPYVTPAAAVPVRDWDTDTNALVDSTARYADGGYFDNSGVETARDFIRGIKFANDENPESRKLIELIAMVFPTRKTRRQDRSSSFDELAAPVRTLASTRGARSGLAKRRAYAESGDRFRYSTLRLDDTERSFTLGWTLSGLTFDRIECHLWNDVACDRILRLSGNTTNPDTAKHPAITRWNRCILKKLQDGRPDNGEAEICDSKGSGGAF